MSKILEENVVDIENVIYGESTQDGIPTTENPVEIKSKKIFNSNYIQRVDDIQCPLLVAISQEEYMAYKSLENKLKQRDEVINEIKTFLEDCGIDLTTCKECSIYDVNGIVIYGILQKYKGDSNEYKC